MRHKPTSNSNGNTQKVQEMKTNVDNNTNKNDDEENVSNIEEETNAAYNVNDDLPADDELYDVTADLADAYNVDFDEEYHDDTEHSVPSRSSSRRRNTRVKNKKNKTTLTTVQVLAKYDAYKYNESCFNDKNLNVCLICYLQIIYCTKCF